MSRFVDFEELLEHPEFSSLYRFVMVMYDNIPFDNEDDYLCFRAALRHILEIMEKDDEFV